MTALFPGAGTPGRITRLRYRCSDDGSVALEGVGPYGPGEPVPGASGPGTPWFAEPARGLLTRPLLRGHRRDGPASWSPLFAVSATTTTLPDGRELLRVSGEDPGSGLRLATEVEALVGGSLRLRQVITNLAPTEYLLDGLEIAVPVGDDLTEALDFTGRHESERHPQRRPVTDGLWSREARGGRPGHDDATLLVLGEPGFGTTRGRVVGCHVAWSGNTVLRVERTAATATTIGGGELLLPGEILLGPGQTYSTPWVYLAASTDGLDGLADRFHRHQRSWASHPGPQPVTLNVWEAVFFDHDATRLGVIADRAAAAGVERFVLDDGWFHGRRDDTAGLGDWRVDTAVWPDGLDPLIERVRALGMEFGLWFEPEMVNPDSELFREHPDWILASPGRTPILQRHQWVLDLGRAEVRDHLFERIDAVLSRYRIDAVKWDHNRDLTDAGSGPRGAPGVHAQTEGFLVLLDRLREAHPDVVWESCASGGGRLDVGLLSRVQRVWTSDGTDALARQRTQYWTAQLVAPEYLGSHVSAPVAPTTGRTLPLGFRAATALFGAFGVEWDLGSATAEELAELAEWTALYRRHRAWMAGGRLVRPESPDPAVLLHGRIAADLDRALIAHVQLDESAHSRGTTVRVPGLAAGARYRCRWEGPVDLAAVSRSPAPRPSGPTGGAPVSGAALAETGFWVPRRRPQTATLVLLERLADPVD